MTYQEAFDIIEENYFIGDVIEKDGIQYEILHCFPSPSESLQLGFFLEDLRNGQTPAEAILRFITRNDLEIYMKVKNILTGEELDGFVQNFGSVE